MKKILLRTTLLITLLTSLSGCLDPNYYIWKSSIKESSNSFIETPWVGADKKATEQYTEYVLPYSDKGYGSRSRWKISIFNKTSTKKVGKRINQYLIKNNMLQRWGFRRSKFNKRNIYRAQPTYEIKVLSINPIIVTMRPYVDEDFINDGWSLRHPNNAGYFPSEYLVNPIHYGTTLKYQKDLLYFSPDLDILPQPLNLKRGKTTTVSWNKLFNSGTVEFTEKNGTVYTKRTKNKTGKDSKKAKNYDPRYHLTLIKKEKETMRRWKEIKRKSN